MRALTAGNLRRLDVKAMCGEPPPPRLAGVVYFAQARNTRRVKIGWTKASEERSIWGDALARLADLQTGCPYPLRLLRAIEGDRCDEATWHGRFRAYRVHGEWFEFVDPVAEIGRIQG